MWTRTRLCTQSVPRRTSLKAWRTTVAWPSRQVQVRPMGSGSASHGPNWATDKRESSAKASCRDYRIFLFISIGFRHIHRAHRATCTTCQGLFGLLLRVSRGAETYCETLCLILLYCCFFPFLALFLDCLILSIALRSNRRRKHTYLDIRP